MSNKGFKTRAFFTRIVLPSFLTIGMFIIALYFVLLPEFEDVIMGRKRNMIRELTYSAWSILNEYEKSERDSVLTREQAQREAAKRIEFLRYGEEGKDYFWITDMHPRMIMHPYRKDLNGTDLTNFKDPNGKKLFVEFVQTVKTSDEGFVDYMWQWKDDSTRIVPKLSYVRVFKPWGWIIGTGIYVEDVKVEIKKLEYRVLNISMIITILIFALLTTITFQSFRIERRRFKAEEELKKSRERYKMLVDSATEGTLMVLGGNIIFSNRIIQEMLGYSQEELMSTYILKLLPEEEKSGTDSIRLFKDVAEGVDQVTKFESKLLGKDGNIVNTELSISSIMLGKEKAYIIKVKEISSEKQEFLLNRNKFKNLTDNIKIGVFRTTIDRKGHFVEANPAAIEMLGFQTEKELFAIHIIDLFHDRQDRYDFMDELMKKYSVKNKIIRIKKRDATVTTIAVSAVLVIDEEGNPLFCDGILEDITEQKQKEEQQETMIAELQTSMHFMNQPLSHFLKELLACNIHTSIREAATLMTNNRYSAILIVTDNNDAVGIVTDQDIRKRFLIEDMKSDEPVHRIMSAPLVSISERALLYEAIAMMQDRGLSHLGVRNSQGQVISLVDINELLKVHRYSLSFLVREIEDATTVSAIAAIYKRLPQLILSLINSGAESQNLTRITSVVFDAIISQLMKMSIEKMGEPPVQFSFIVMGSAGREEQTLATDQDNAIIYEDVSAEKEEEVRAYFLKLGEIICNNLNEVGYHFCNGNIMAKNPKWCKPLSEWKENFRQWISSAEPKDLLDINICFDFRTVYGNTDFISDLRKHIHNLINAYPGFFIFMTNNIMNYKSPLTLFGNIALGASKSKPDTFDIKYTMLPIIDMARLYSLKFDIHESNTFSRYKKLVEIGFMTDDQLRERIEAYRRLLQLRFKNQAEMIMNNQLADNYINPNKLSNIEQIMIRKVLGQISEFLTKLNYDFKGSA